MCGPPLRPQPPPVLVAYSPSIDRAGPGEPPLPDLPAKDRREVGAGRVRGLDDFQKTLAKSNGLGHEAPSSWSGFYPGGRGGLPPFISHILSFDTVRSRLRALALSLAALPLCLVAVFFYVILKDEIEVRTLASIDRTLGLQRLYLDNWMEDRLAEVTFLADLPQLRSFDDAAMAEVFASFRRSSSAFDALIYVEPDGHTRMDTSGNPGLYVGDRAYFDAARQGRSRSEEHRVGKECRSRWSPYH